jgi:hypothetical protein
LLAEAQEKRTQLSLRKKVRAERDSPFFTDEARYENALALQVIDKSLHAKKRRV